MENKILYFGYGANSQKEMMASITGNQNLKGLPARLKDMSLYVQRFDQVPDNISPASPIPISPRQLLAESWNDKFMTYMIKPKEGSIVKGTIWELSPKERDLVREWELIDFGWYKDLQGKALTEDGIEVKIETEGWRGGQEVDREVDGENYPPFLNELEDFQKVAEKARREYFERIESMDGGFGKKEKE